MNKTFLDVRNSVVPQTTAEALVSSETPPSRHYSAFVSSHRSSTALDTPHCEDHVHRKLKHLPDSLC